MEQHKRQPRGIWIPEAMLKLLENKRLVPTEVILLALIDSLVSEDRGCFASNAYLADMMRLSEDRIRRMISRLRKIKLVRQLAFDGRRRYLETVWSRIGEGVVYAQAARACTPTPGSPTGNLDNKGEPPEFQNLIIRTDTMPFFDDSSPKVGVCLDDECLGWADELHEIVTLSRKRRTKWRRTTWANEFRILRDELEGDGKRIQRAIDWYEAHVNEKGVPKIDSGSSFRRHFNWLEDAMAKKKVDLTKVVISDQSRKILEKLRMVRWPKGSDSQLPSVVELSLKAYFKFGIKLAKFRKTIENEKPKDHWRRLCERIRDMHLSHPNAFIERWMMMAHNSIANWAEWSGNLETFIFSPDHKLFKQMGRQWTADYCADPDRWDQLMEKLNAFDD